MMCFFNEADPAPWSKLILWDQNNNRPHHRCAHKGEEKVRKNSLGAAEGRPDSFFRLITLAYTPHPSSAHNVCSCVQNGARLKANESSISAPPDV